MRISSDLLVYSGFPFISLKCFLGFGVRNVQGGGQGVNTDISILGEQAFNLIGVMLRGLG